MKFIGHLLIKLSFLLILITGCTSPRMAEELQAGKVHFEDGNFKRAFHYLLPAAVNGNVDAQYAVGYMYYYGYGVCQDDESGIFWMQKAAANHCIPAMRALDLIHQTPPCPVSCQSRDVTEFPCESKVLIKPEPILRAAVVPTCHDTVEYRDAPPQYKGEVIDEGLTHVTIPPHVPLSKSAPILMPHTFHPAISSYNQNQNIKKFACSLQLLGSYDIKNVKEVQKKDHLEGKTHIGLTKHNNKAWYVLLYGKYPSLLEAELAITNVPSSIKTYKPWVRQIKDIHLLV